MKPAVLYISYDGMLEPLGQSQVISYLEALSGEYEIRIVSFEKKQDRTNRGKVKTIRSRLDRAGIKWTPLAYHKTPSALATAWDILVGTLVVLWFSVLEKPSILHTRSYVPALMALPAKYTSRAKLLFDIRGFWADERVDGGLWPRNGALYKTAKFLEKRFFLSADHVVTLTHSSEKIIANLEYLQDQMPPVSVIPTCADLARFDIPQWKPETPFVFGYVGSIGTWYLFDETMAFFNELLKLEPDARFLVINRHEHSLVSSIADRHGINPDRLEILAAEHSHMPAQIGRMHAAAALIKPCYSKLSSAPTKLAEYLGCGVPCLGNVGVGDMEHILENRKTGIALRGFCAEEMAQAAKNLVKLARKESTAQRCREVALDLFSLATGVAGYRKIYQGLNNHDL